MRKFVIWGLIIAVLAGGIGGVIGWRQRQQAATLQEVLRTDEVIVGDLEISVAASGNVTAKQRTDLLMPSSGTITGVEVEANERVRAGQTLARLDTDRLERAVEQAQIALEQAQLNLDTAQEATDPEELRLAELALSGAAQTLEVARVGRETARIDAEDVRVQAQRQREQAYIRLRDAADDEKEAAQEAYTNAEAQERIAQLNAELIIEQAESQWQSAYTAYEQAQRNLEILESDPDADQIQQLKLQIERAALRLEQAERNLREAQITAPYDGTVAAVYVEEETRQDAGTRTFTLLDDQAYDLDVTIDEIDIGAVEPGQSAFVTLDAYPDLPLEGVVDTIDPAAAKLGGLVAYRVRLRISETDGVRVRDGMTASVRILTDTIEDVTLVPNWAVRADQTTGQTYVYQVENGEPVRVDIETARRNDTYTEVVDGLAEGAVIGLVTEERDSPIPSGPPTD